MKIETLAVIENIYISYDFKEKFNDNSFNNLRSNLLNLKNQAINANKEIYFETKLNTFEICSVGIQMYPYRFRIKDKYDVLIANKIGSNSPVYVILSANYMWLNDNLKQLEESLVLELQDLLFYLNKKKFKIILKEGVPSRIDIANHNTLITNIQEYLPEGRRNERIVTRLKSYSTYGRLIGNYKEETNYLKFGSHDLCLRIYNKAREVIEMQYKGFFIKLWYELGLIDKYDFEIYDRAYKIGSNYELNVGISILEQNKNKLLKYFAKEYDEIIQKYANGINIIEDIENLIKKNNRKYGKIKKPKVVYNVEFQVCRKVLKSMNIYEQTNEINNIESKIKLNSVQELINNVNNLYNYLTNKVFRVIIPNDKTRKTNCITEYIWNEISNTKVSKINSEMLNSQRQIIREYSWNLDKLITSRRLANSMTHLAYLEDLGEDATLIDGINCAFDNLSKLTENELIKYQRMQYIQYKRYGNKNKQVMLKNEEIT